MKIIAAVSEDKVLAEVTMDEVAQILGFRAKYEDGFRSQSIKVGSEIPVDGIASTARYVRTMDQNALANLREKVESVLSQVDGVQSTVQKINLFEDIRDPAK